MENMLDNIASAKGKTISYIKQDGGNCMIIVFTDGTYLVFSSSSEYGKSFISLECKKDIDIYKALLCHLGLIAEEE